MAATVNARDVQLQATSPANRVLAVTMASNIVVSQDNVSGLGLVVAGTKMVSFDATSQVFQIAKTGTVSPASTTLKASLRNLTNTPVVTVTAGTITSSLTLVGGQLTINNANMTTDSATLRLTVVQDGVTYTDDVTLVKVREGADAIVGFLTNESHTVPADYLGNVTSYTGAGGSFKVFSGTTDITTSCSFSIQAGGNPSALTVSLGATTGVFSVTGGMPVGTEVTTLTLKAVFGAATIVKTFTLGKTRLPALARFIDLQANSQVFQVLKSGSVNPASITLTSRNSGLAGTPVFTVSPGTATITSTPGSSVCNITYAGMGANESVTVTVTHDGLSDVVTLVKVREGVDGASGTNGTNGTPGAAGTNGINGANGVDAIVGFLTNEATTIPTTSTGTGGDFSSAGGTFKLFQGIVDKTGNGVTYSVVSSTGVTISIAQTGVYTVTGMSANSGSALLRAVFGTVTVDKVYSIAKSLAGTNGAAGTNGTNGTNGTPGTNGINGTNGSRGSRTFYVPLAGGTNTYSDTLATTTATVEGGPVMNDLVIQYNTSVGFSQSKFYQIINSVGSWAVVNAVVDGNLLVSGSVAATHIQANTFTADNAVTRGLTVRDLSGNIILSSGQNLDYTKVGGTKPPANATFGADWATNVTGAAAVNTSITNAQTAADNAIAALAKITSDNVLAKGEKGDVILEYSTITAEYPGIQTQSNSLGIGTSAERVSFDAAISALNTYMAGLSPVHTDTTTDTTIVGSTFRQKFIDYYTSKQTVLNAIAAKAATTSTWAGVTGTGKPADNATVGATFGSNISGQITSVNASTFIAAVAINNAQIGTLDAQKINTGFLSADRIQAGTVSVDKLNVGVGANLLQNSTFAHGMDYWNREESPGVDAVLRLNFSVWFPRGGAGISFQQPNNLYAGGSEGTYYQGVNSAEVPITPEQRYEFSAYTGAHRCNVSVFVAFNDANGTAIAFSTYMYNNNESLGGTTLASFKRLGGFITAPAGAATARLYIRKTTTLPGQSDSWLMLTQTMIAPAAPNQTTLSPWSLGGSGTKITGAGIETNSITADKINGTNLAVVNGTFSGSLQGATGSFSGSLSAATGSFSGSLTASAVNAVNSINIAGEAVTVPRSAAANNLVNIGGEVQILASPNTDFGGIPIAVFIHTENESIKSPYYKLYRNGTLIDAWFGTQTRIYIEAPGGAVQYTLNAVDVSGNGDPCVVRRRSFVLIGCRR
jgi:hypothetical protein